MDSAKQTKTEIGTVVGHKMNKTAVVEVTRKLKHRVFKKYYQKARKFKVHDENNECLPGDKVLIVETRPISKTKSWKLEKILVKAAS